MNIFYAIIFFILGSSLASFYGVVGARLPLHESIISPSSHCTKCHHKLAWYELIPVFSFLFLRGKCKHCHTKLSIADPLLELFTGLCFVFFYLKYGISYSFFMSLILISLLDLIFISDFKYMIILDSPLVISGILIFILRWIYFGITEAFLYVGYGIIMFLFMLLVGLLGSLIFKREALGGGDIKLAFIVGMAVGIPYGFIVLILSTFLALPYATFSLLTNTSKEVPFGPFIISALCIVFLFYDKFSYILQLIY